MTFKKQKILYCLLPIICLIIVLYALSGLILSTIGKFLVNNEEPINSDAIVVLNAGVEYFPRLIEASYLYKQGYAKKVVINGNRKNDTLRELERKGFESCCPWHEDRLRILDLLGVPREAVLAIGAEDAYDTVSEAQMVGDVLIKEGVETIIITTSKYHTRRAGFIWQRMYGNRLEVSTVAAGSDFYDPKAWWKSGRQIRWVLAEYGAWVYYYWKRLTMKEMTG